MLELLYVIYDKRMISVRRFREFKEIDSVHNSALLAAHGDTRWAIRLGIDKDRTHDPVRQWL